MIGGHGCINGVRFDPGVAGRLGLGAASPLLEAGLCPRSMLPGRYPLLIFVTWGSVLLVEAY